MISYLKFKEIFDNMTFDREPEIEIYFKSRKNPYLIIKYEEFVTFQRCGLKEEQSGEIRFETLENLAEAKTIDDIVLKDDWEDIEDILFDCNFSVISDKEDIYNLYGIKI